MSAAQAETGGLIRPPVSPTLTTPRLLFQYLTLVLLDGLAFWFLFLLFRDELWPLFVAIGSVVAAINFFFLRRALAPLRWQIPAMIVSVLFVLYPIIFTLYSSTTNYSDGHILTKQQAVSRLGRDQYLPEGGATYAWTAFRSESGEFALWLTDESGATYLVLPGQPIEPAQPEEGIIGPADENGVPLSVEGFQRLERRDVVRYLSVLDGRDFGEAPDTVRIRSLNAAAALQQRYLYDEADDAIVDQTTGQAYFGNERTGFFTSSDGVALLPGYFVNAGFRNYQRLISSPALRGPFLQVFAWTVAFAFFSVLTTFSLGLLLALAFNDPLFPGRTLVRSLLILPWTLPGIIGVLMWRGMLNPALGVISLALQSTIGWSPPFFTDPIWSKVAILLVNLWLGYPYMMLVCMGALQAIPSDVYEAAAVDGASAWQRFWNITLPLLLVSVGPLLIASFVFNFNNFTVIFGFNEGRPPIAGSPTPAGHTDILISYTYRLAFEGGRGADYAYAASITAVIFLITAVITLFQYRFTRTWEEVSESV